VLSRLYGETPFQGTDARPAQLHRVAGGAPVISDVTTWADQRGARVLAWNRNVWHGPNGPGPAHLLIRDAVGTPSDGHV
jgi:hypothetical protein